MMKRSLLGGRSAPALALTVALVGVVGGAVVQAPTAAQAEACRSVPAPGAEILRASEAWERFGVSGDGIRVGIISNSFDTGIQPTAADDVAAGVLPGPGNPCGWDAPVEVLADSATAQSDEGRAMAQVVHGIAPGAQLVFSTNDDSGAGFAAAVQRLREAEVDIIVDDVGVRDDLVFQQGASATAVQEAVDAGVVFVSAAGNYGGVGAAGYPSAGFPITGWSDLEYRPTPCPPAVVDAVTARTGAEVSVDCIDFDPGETADPLLTATVPPNAIVPLSIFWSEPVGAVTTRFGFAVTDPATGEVGFGWALDAGVPMMEAGIESIGETSAAERSMSLVREVAPGAGVPGVAVIFQAQSSASSLLALDHFRSEGSVTVGATMLGHQAVPSNIAVAAVDATTLQLETFSSAGPAATFVGVLEPYSVLGPAVAGVDGVPVSFEIDGGTTFYGTSAAAPSIAGVVALMLQAAPDADPATIREALAASARADAFTSPYDPTLDPRRFTGAGLADAVGAVAAVAPQPAPSVVPAGQPQLAASGADGGPLLLLVALGVLTLGATVLATARMVRSG